MKKINKSSGFTLVELIVAMVISAIVLSLVGTFFISFTKTSRQSKAKQLMVYEQNVVVRCFEKFENAANLAGKSITLNKEQKTIEFSASDNSDIPEVSIKYDKATKTLSYNTLKYSLDKVVDIDITNVPSQKKLFLCKLTFDDESVYQFSIYIINQAS